MSADKTSADKSLRIYAVLRHGPPTKNKTNFVIPHLETPKDIANKTGIDMSGPRIFAARCYANVYSLRQNTRTSYDAPWKVDYTSRW